MPRVPVRVVLLAALLAASIPLALSGSGAKRAGAAPEAPAEAPARTVGDPAPTPDFVAPPGTEVFLDGDVVVSRAKDSAEALGWVEPLVVPAGASKFRPVTPTRVLDTRTATAVGYAGSKPAAGAVVRVQVTGLAGIPAGARAVVANVTITEAAGPGFVVAYPTGGGRPGSSTVNAERAGQTIANGAIVPIGGDGSISLYTLVGAHLLVDVTGYFEAVTGSVADGRLVPLAPSRIFDSRPASRVNWAGAKPAAASTTVVPVTGRGGVPATGVSGVVLNLTATETAAPGYVQVGPSGGFTPGASSNLNVGRAGQTIPNNVIVPVGGDGAVGIYVLTSTHLVVDVVGYFTSGTAPTSSQGLFVPVTPSRVRDTRFDEYYPGPGAFVRAPGPGAGGVPTSGVAALALNVTLTESAAAGFVQAAAAGVVVPGRSSTLNAERPGQTIANGVIVPINRDGFDLYTQSGTHLIADVAGWFTGVTRGGAADPVGLLLDGTMTRGLGRGVDLFAVWVCVVPGDTSEPFYRSFLDQGRVRSPTPEGLAALAQQNVAPYFQQVSRGLYEPLFIAAGYIFLGPTEGPGACLSRAQAQSGWPFSNVLVTDTTAYGGGFGGPGLIAVGPDGEPFGYPVGWSPDWSRRGLWVGGGVIDPSSTRILLTHEIGHTLHWPHSYLGPASEYDNPMDIMSGSWALHTIAVNRWASGWIDPTELVTHDGGTTVVDLAGPERAGTQVLAVRSGVPGTVMTIEAKPKLGFDANLRLGGVAVHFTDQRWYQCPDFRANYCASVKRRTAQARGAPNSTDHVLAVGQQFTVAGITVRVLSATADGWRVSVSGTYPG